MLISKKHPITTAIHTYEHPVWGSRVDLVEMIHFGQPEYYKAIQALADTRSSEGAAVHYESTLSPTADELREASLFLRAKYRALVSYIDTAPPLSPELGLCLVSQMDALRYRDHWKNRDAKDIEIARRLGIAQILALNGLYKLSVMMERRRSKRLEDRRDEFLYSLSAVVDGSANVENGNVLERVIIGGSDKVFLDYRNEVALGAYDDEVNTDPAADVVFLWGAAHRPGLEAGFLGRGFKKVEEERIVAIDPNM